MATKTKEVDPQVAVDEKIVQLRNEGHKWAEIGDAVDLPPGKCMFRYACATVAPKDRVKNADGPTIVKMRDADLLSWGTISARTGIPESRCRTMYTEATGNTTLGNRIGKGGRFPGGTVDGERPAKAARGSKAKAAEEQAQSAVVIQLTEAGDDLEAVQGILTARAIKTVAGDVIKVRTVKAVKNGAVQVVDDESGKARAVKIANIAAVSKQKVRLQG